jgi:hypothetical protein
MRIFPSNKFISALPPSFATMNQQFLVALRLATEVTASLKKVKTNESLGGSGADPAADLPFASTIKLINSQRL